MAPPRPTPVLPPAQGAASAPGLAELHALVTGSGPLPPALLLLAHPDDESMGPATLLPRLGPCGWLAYVTDGTPRGHRDGAALGFANPAAYAHARWRELQAALGRAGVPQARVLALHHTDQEAIHAAVPLATWLAQWLAAHRPALLITHAYEGGHPDHDTCAWAAQQACAALAASALPVPWRIEFASYFDLGPGLRAGDFIPAAASLAAAAPPSVRKELTAHERALRAELLAAHATQRAILDLIPRGHEAYRAAPQYDFAQPPHAGRLLYEQWGLPLDGAAWRALACAAARHTRGADAHA